MSKKRRAIGSERGQSTGEDRPDKTKNTNQSSALGVWVAIGAGIGAGLGAATDKMGVGVAIGVALGVVVGVIIGSLNKEEPGDGGT